KGDELRRRPDAKPVRGEAGTPTAPAELVARRAELDAPPAAPPPDVPAAGSRPSPRSDAPSSASRAPSRRVRHRGVKSVASHLGEARPAEDADAVFARAVKERAQGRTFDAIATFRSLQDRFPDSPPAIVSRVSLGDLLLDRG